MKQHIKKKFPDYFVRVKSHKKYVHEAMARLLHEEKKLLSQQVSSAGIGTADFFGNIYRFFCWIHRLFVNSTDELVKSTEMSVRITDFSFFLKSAFLTDTSIDFTG